MAETEYTDLCFACRSVTPSWKVLGSDLIPGAYRTYHVCKEQHPEVPSYTELRWWTDWKGGEVHERIWTTDPSMGGGGTTWSGVELARY